jgi:glycine/D-amino acid oxidase-like deaminating enzyme
LKTIFEADADVGFREQGYLILSSQEGDAALAGNVTLQRSMEADIELIAGPDLAQAFPWISSDGVSAGAFGRSGEGWFDPPSLASLFRNRARAKGVAIMNDRVTGINVGTRVESIDLAERGRIACSVLVNAAGPWAGDVAAMVGIELPVEPRKRYVFVIDCRAPPDALDLAPLTVDPSGVWFRPEGRFFLCGKSPRPEQEPPASDLERVDHAFFEQEVWPHLAHRVPAFESVKVTNAWAGFYDYNTLDQNAIIGAHPDLANFYFANGFSGHGAQQAAAAGRAIAELIVQGAFQTIDLTRFGYARIARGAPLTERNVI